MSYSPTDFLKVANQTAHHFGFQTVEQFQKDPDCKNCKSSLPHTITNSNKKIDAHGGLLSTGLSTFCEQKLHALEKPVLLYSIEQTPRVAEPAISFHIFNVEKSIAEAILIQMTRAMATELGHINHHVRINSIGDRDSVTRYTRELTNYLKKRLETMPSDARELMKEHPLSALAYLIEKEHELGYRSPNPLEFLSDQSRKHFREIIEFLDMSETPYEIDPRMIGHHECYSDAIFSVEIEAGEDGVVPLSIKGGRINELIHRNTQTQTPGVGVVVVMKNNKAPVRIPRAKATKPKVYVVQLGFGPKIKSLMLVDSLRQAGIPVYHNLASDSLSAQLREAEGIGVQYTVIIGQKEFVEDTVIFRDMDVRNQEYIPLNTLIKVLKRRNKAFA